MLNVKGIGVDMVNAKRIKSLIEKYGDKFLERTYTPYEILTAQARQDEKRLMYYATRFAAKEAVAKSLGTGIGKSLKFRDIETRNAPSGKPEITVLNGDFNDHRFELSLSDEPPHAIAFVICLTTALKH